MKNKKKKNRLLLPSSSVCKHNTNAEKISIFNGINFRSFSTSCIAHRTHYTYIISSCSTRRRRRRRRRHERPGGGALVLLETAGGRDRRGRAVDDVRVQLRDGAARPVPDGRRVRRGVGHLAAGHVRQDDSRRVFRVRGRVAVQVRRHGARLRADGGRARRVRADHGGRAPGPGAVLRPVRRAVHVRHAAHQRAQAVAAVRQPVGTGRAGVLRVHVPGERGHVPGRDVFRGAVPHAPPQVSQDQPRPAAARRGDDRRLRRRGRGLHGGKIDDGRAVRDHRQHRRRRRTTGHVRRRFLRRSGQTVDGQRRGGDTDPAPADPRRHGRARRPVRPPGGPVAVHVGRDDAVRHLLPGVRRDGSRLEADDIHLYVAAAVHHQVFRDRGDGAQRGPTG